MAIERKNCSLRTRGWFRRHPAQARPAGLLPARLGMAPPGPSRSRPTGAAPPVQAGGGPCGLLVTRAQLGLVERGKRYYLLRLGWPHRMDLTDVIEDDDSIRVWMLPRSVAQRCLRATAPWGLSGVPHRRLGRHGRALWWRSLLFPWGVTSEAELCDWQRSQGACCGLMAGALVRW